MLKKTHLVFGVLGLLVFALQGQYMDIVQDHLAGLADGPRMLYRSSHIYFLLASLLNVVLGVYLPERDQPVTPLAQRLVSAIVLLSPLLLLAGFFLEPGMAELYRPYTAPALYGLFGTGVLLSLVGIIDMRKRRATQGRQTSDSSTIAD